MHDRPPPELLSMGAPGSGGAPGYGGSAGTGGGAAGAPPLGKFGSLRVVSGNDQGKVIELNRPVTTIGRGADQMLVIADIAVSRRHLQVHMTQTGYRLQDMGSPNGTMVNGKRVSEVQLMDGDQIEVGNSLLRFEHPPSRPQQDAPSPPAPPPAPMIPPAMMPQAPAYAPPMAPAAPQMGYPPPGYPPQAPYMPPLPGQPMPPLQPPGYPMAPTGQPPLPPALATSAPAAISSQAHPAQLLDSNASSMAVPGLRGALQHPQKRLIYFGAVGAALLVGLLGLFISLAKGSNPQKPIDKATDLFLSGTREFASNRYAAARKTFEAALQLAPDSQELRRYIEACDSEDRVRKLIDAAKKENTAHRYVEALKQLAKVDKSSIQYEDAQQQTREIKREAVKDVLSQALSLAKSDNAAALEKINKGLEELDSENAELIEFKNKLSSMAAPKPAEEPVVAENPPTEKPKPEPVAKAEPKAEPKHEKPKPEPKKEVKKEVKKETPPAKPEPPASGGDLASNKQALAAYKNRDFVGASNAMKAIKNPKAQATAKDLDELKAKTDQASKLESSNPAGALAAYQAAAAIDKRLGGGLSGFYSSKITPLQSKAGGKPAASDGANKDAQADQFLSQAKSLVTRNPTQARNLCRKVMLLYNNSPKNPKVQEAYRLLNSIKGGKDDDDDF